MFYLVLSHVSVIIAKKTPHSENPLKEDMHMQGIGGANRCFARYSGMATQAKWTHFWSDNKTDLFLYDY